MTNIAKIDPFIYGYFENEALELYRKNLPRELTAFGGIGYKELFEYFDGKCSLDEAVDAIKQGSRRYAKRQLTWFRRNEKLKNISFGESLIPDAFEAVDKFLEECML